MEEIQPFINKFILNPFVVALLPLVISIISLVPIIDNILKFILAALAILIACALFFLKTEIQQMKDYFSDKKDFYFLYNAFLKYVYIKEELLYVSLINKEEAEIKRCIVIRNLSEITINDYYIPWFYDLYEPDKIKDYRPQILSMKPLYLEKICSQKENRKISDDMTNNCIIPEGIMQFEKKNKKILSARDWIRLPIFLEPKESISVSLDFLQKHIYRYYDTPEGESSGVLISSPTGVLRIVVKPPRGKKIFPVTDHGESVSIINTSLNITDFREIYKVDPPKFTLDKAEWIINNPKVGHLYLLKFRIEPPDEEPLTYEPNFLAFRYMYTYWNLK